MITNAINTPTPRRRYVQTPMIVILKNTHLESEMKKMNQVIQVSVMKMKLITTLKL